MNTLGNFDYAIFSFMLIVTLIIGLHNGLKKYYVIFINFVFTKSLKSKINTDSLENGSKINDYLIANGEMIENKLHSLINHNLLLRVDDRISDCSIITSYLL